MSDSSPLELTPEAMRELVDLAVKKVIAHVASIADQPCGEMTGDEQLARSLMEPLPETGQAPGPLLDRLFEEIIPPSLNPASPGYLAYIPGGGLFHAAVADLISNAVNRYVTVWSAAPGLAQIEATVIRWFCGMMGYPEQSGGFLASGGSIANLSAVVMARSERLPEEFLRGAVYASDQVHHSVDKAAMLAGFPKRAVRTVPVDDQYRIRIDGLRERIRQDRAAGMQPFLVVGSAGTTNTGAVDDLEALADVARSETLWLHLDAAYGGFFMLTERGRSVMQGIERADSITLNPHKGLFLPYGTGCLLARDRRALERTHRVDADYMPTREHAEEFVDFCDISPELSRDVRGLRVWLPFKMHGVAPFRDALDEKLDLAHWATDELEKIPGIEIVARPQLSTVAFRLVQPGMDREEMDRLNRELLRRINRRQRVNLTGTMVDRGFVLRICVLSVRTHLDRMKLCLEDIRNSIAELPK